MRDDRLAFRRGVVRPVECLREGWQLIREDYWLFLGITVVGTLISSMARGILTGPITSGITICLLRQMRGDRVRFEMLFDGFKHFLQSFLAVLIIGVPLALAAGALWVGFILITGAMLTALDQRGPPNAAGTWFLTVLAALLFVSIVSLIVAVSAAFLFTIPLIVDRKLSAVEAIMLSMRAAFGNMGGVFGVLVLILLLNFAGLLACCVGVFFVEPLIYAITVTAYRKVFPDRDWDDDETFDEPNDPDDGTPSNAIQVERPRSQGKPGLPAGGGAMMS